STNILRDQGRFGAASIKSCDWTTTEGSGKYCQLPTRVAVSRVWGHFPYAKLRRILIAFTFVWQTTTGVTWVQRNCRMKKHRMKMVLYMKRTIIARFARGRCRFLPILLFTNVIQTTSRTPDHRLVLLESAMRRTAR